MSPKTVIATVRGIGVAVMTSTCGGRIPFSRGVPLLDAEAVLLVDDDEGEIGELHVLLDEGMGADDDPSLARGRVEQRAPPGARRLAAR